MWIVWQFWWAQMEKAKRTADVILDAPSRTFIEIATVSTTTAPMETGNYAWMISILLCSLSLLFLLVFYMACLPTQLSMKLSREIHKNKAKKLEAQFQHLQNAHEIIQSDLLDLQNELVQQKAKNDKYEQDLEQLKEVYQAKLGEMESNHILQLQERDAAHRRLLEQNDADHAADIQRRNTRHSDEMETRKRQHDETMKKSQALQSTLKADRGEALQKLIQLSESVQEKDANIKDLKEEIDFLKHRLAREREFHEEELEIEKRKLRKAMQAVHNIAHNRTRRHLNEALDQCDKYEACVRSYKDDKTRAETVIQQLKAQLATKETELADESTKAKNLAKELESLRVSHTANEQAIAWLQEAVAGKPKKLAEKLEEWRGERSQLLLELQAKTLANKNLKLAKENAQKELEAARVTLSQLQQKKDLDRPREQHRNLTEDQQEIVRLANEHISLLETAHEAKRQELIRAAEQVTSQWQAANEAKTRELDQALENLTRARNELNQLGISRMESNEAKVQVEKAHDKLQVAYHGLSKKLDKADNTHAELQATNDRLSKKLDKAENTIKTQAGMITALNDRQDAERSSASNGSNEATEQLKTLLAQSQQATAVADQRAEQLQALLEQSQQVTAATDRRVEELSNKLASAEQELEPLKKIRGQLSMLQTQRERLQNAKNRADGEKESLVAENFELRGRLARECMCKKQQFQSEGNQNPSQGASEPLQDDMEFDLDEPSLEDRVAADPPAGEAGTENGGYGGDTEAGMPDAGAATEADQEADDMDVNFYDVLPTVVQARQEALNQTLPQYPGPADGGLALSQLGYMTDAELAANFGNQPVNPVEAVPGNGPAASDALSDAGLADLLQAQRREAENAAAPWRQLGESSRVRETPLVQDLALNTDHEGDHAEEETSWSGQGKGKEPSRPVMSRTRIFPASGQATTAPLPGLLPPTLPGLSIPSPTSLAAPSLPEGASAANQPPVPAWFRTPEPTQGFQFTSEYDLSAPGAFDDETSVPEQAKPAREEPPSTATPRIIDFSSGLELDYTGPGCDEFSASSALQETTAPHQALNPTAFDDDNESDLSEPTSEEMAQMDAYAAEITRENEQAEAARAAAEVDFSGFSVTVAPNQTPTPTVEGARASGDDDDVDSLATDEEELKFRNEWAAQIEAELEADPNAYTVVNPSQQPAAAGGNGVELDPENAELADLMDGIGRHGEDVMRERLLRAKIAREETLIRQEYEEEQSKLREKNKAKIDARKRAVPKPRKRG